MTKTEKREEIMDRYHGVIAERNLQEKNGIHYKKLSQIAKLILDELKLGNKYRHIMFMQNGLGSEYDYRVEEI